ncbi:MAG: hypothetical protein ACM3VT_10170 [Solirubrobacterales bacterium]
MDPDRMDEMARDPRFIPGIYNYCDRWCERCTFTFRCMNYAMTQEVEAGDSSSRDVENEAFWDRLHETFDATIDRIEEAAEEMDIDVDLDDEDFDEYLQEQDDIHEAAHSQPCSRTAMRYIEVAEQWLKSHEDLAVPEKGPSSRGDKAGGDLPVIRDCLEVIRWYQHQIWVKLCRAITGTIRVVTEDWEGMQEDADGSAKVAILGIERSMAAWATLLNHFPDHEDAIFAMGTLKRLLRQVEAAFPNARAFRRPGFDTEETER